MDDDKWRPGVAHSDPKVSSPRGRACFLVSLLPLARLDAARNHKSAPGHRLSRIHCHASFDETFDSLQGRELLYGVHKDQFKGLSQNSSP